VDGDGDKEQGETEELFLTRALLPFDTALSLVAAALEVLLLHGRTAARARGQRGRRGKGGGAVSCA